MKALKWILPLIVVIAVLVFIFRSDNLNDLFTDSGTADVNTAAVQLDSSNEAPHDPELVRTTIIFVSRDYHDDPAKADQSFKGKRVGLGGEVVSTEKSFIGNTIAYFRGSTHGSIVAANFKSGQQEQAANLKAGDKVIMECKGGGLSGDMPVLDDCEIH